MHTRSPAVALFLFHGAPGEGQPSFIKERAELVRARNPDHDRSHVGHDAETLFMFTYCCFGPLAVVQRANSQESKWKNYGQAADAPSNQPGALRRLHQIMRAPISF